MRPAGTLLALLSAAALLCSHTAMSAAVPTLTLPKSVNVRIQVFEGTNFKTIPNYKQTMSDVLDEAYHMFRIFTDTYTTTFTLTPSVLAEWDDTSISFEALQTKSSESQVENINLYVYFANNEAYTGEFRSAGLKGNMCDADKGFRTLLLNQQGNKQGVTKSARLLVYHTAMLLGVDEDKGACPRGFMHRSYWNRGAKYQKWSACNARNLAEFYAEYTRPEALAMCASPLIASSDGQTTQTNEAITVPSVPTLEIALSVLATFAFPRGDLPGTETYILPSEVLEKAQNILNQGNYQLGVNFVLKTIGNTFRTTYFSADTGSIQNTLNGVKAFFNKSPTFNAGQKFTIFLTDQGLDDFPQQAHPGMNNKFCDADIQYRIFVFDQKKWDSDSDEYQFSKDGITKQVAYYIGRSIGLRYDSGGCPDGFMAARKRNDFPGNSRRKWIAFWNKDPSTLNWNRCNAEDMRKNMESKQCLKDALKWE